MNYKYGKDYKEYTIKEAEALLTSEGFKKMKDRTQQYQHRTLYHWEHKETKQRASISVLEKNGVASVSYSMLKQDRAKRRTSEEIRRANFVLYD